MLFRLALSIALFGVLALAGNPYTAEISSDPGWMDTVHKFERGAGLLGPYLKAVFVGDGNIQRWQTVGAPIWLVKYQLLPSGNLGIVDDKTQNVLWRVENATISNVSPKVVILGVGGANIDAGDNVQDIARGIRAILDQLDRILPGAKVILNSVFPKDTVEKDTQVQELNQMISQFADNSKVYFLDVTGEFETAVGQPKRPLYGLLNDQRLSYLGYCKWAQLLDPLMNQFLA